MKLPIITASGYGAKMMLAVIWNFIMLYEQWNFGTSPVKTRFIHSIFDLYRVFIFSVAMTVVHHLFDSIFL